MPSPHSKDDWKALIEPHLSTSLRTVSETITRTETIQDWLHEASMHAAEGVNSTSGLQGQMQGYLQMKSALEADFPALLEAVDELTEGCGTIEMHWRPLHPNFSRLYVDFERDFSADVFVRLRDPTRESATSAVSSVSNALPDGAPFPNRPNSATGIVAFDRHCLGVRVKQHLGEDREQRYETVTLLPEERYPIENLSAEDASERILDLLSPAGSH